MRILLADDSETNRELVTEILVQAGMSVDVAEHGRAVIEALAASDYDLVLMDCQMPVMDGFTACEEIRKRETGQRAVPIIALTANASRGDRERCLRSGMNDHVLKPVDATQLVATVRRWTTDPSDPVAEVERTRGATPNPTPYPFDAFLRRCQGNRDLANRLLSKFIDGLEEEIRSLRELIEARDSGGARRLAHKIKGAAANLEARHLRDDLENLEGTLETADWTGSRHGLEAVERSSGEFVVAAGMVLDRRSGARSG